MTTKTVDLGPTKPSELPPGVRHLPDSEHVACQACGVVCGPDAPRSRFDVLGWVDELGRSHDHTSEVTFGTCSSCTSLQAHAARTLEAHPGIARMIGSPSIGRHRIVSAFYALSVMRAEPASTYTDDGLRSLLDRLAVPGASATWARRFSPIRRAGISRDTAATEPWSHVGGELRQTIRHEYGFHLADRMPPVSVKCPTRACAWCGIGSVMAKRTATPWTPTQTQTIRGHLCPTCQGYAEHDDPMQMAVLDHVDPDRSLRRRAPRVPDVRGVQPWALSPVGPNRQPWEHLDIDGLRELLARADW